MIVDLLRARGPIERGDVLFGDHRVAELILLVVELDDRARQRRAFFDAETRRERAGGHVAAHHFERDDFDFTHELLAHVHGLDVMRGHADRVQVLHDEPGDLVVDDALAFKDRLLLRVERGRVVFEVLNDGAGLRSLEQDLGLAFVDLLATRHGLLPPRGAALCRRLGSVKARNRGIARARFVKNLGRRGQRHNWPPPLGRMAGCS